MQNDGKISVKTLDKVVVIIIEVSLLVLSYFQINAGITSQLEESARPASSNHFYLLLFICFFFFFVFHRKKQMRLILWLLFGYLVLGYLASTYLSIRSFFSSMFFTFWVFCFSYGNRLVNAEGEITSFFIKTINWIVVLPLSLFCIFKFFTTDMLLDQHATDAFFAIIVYLPFVLMINDNKALKIILYVLLLVVAFISIKRSIIIGFVVCSFFYVLFTDHRNMFKKWYFWLLLAGVIVVGYYLYGIVSETLANRFMNIEDDGGSGRNEIYNQIISSFQQSQWQDALFGHGYQSVRVINHWKLAHNDLLQLLYDYGIIGVSLYLLFLLSMVIHLLKRFSKRNANQTFYAAFVSSLVLFLILSFLNCFIYSNMLIAPIMLALGILDEKNKYEFS